MLLDQPADQPCVLGCEVVLTAETPGVDGPQPRVVATARLGDIVEQRREVEHLRPREVGDQPRAQRVFVRVLRFGEAPQIAHHHQDVFVDGIDVIQVVLHLPYDAAERR